MRSSSRVTQKVLGQLAWSTQHRSRQKDHPASVRGRVPTGLESCPLTSTRTHLHTRTHMNNLKDEIETAVCKLTVKLEVIYYGLRKQKQTTVMLGDIQ